MKKIIFALALASTFVSCEKEIETNCNCGVIAKKWTIPGMTWPMHRPETNYLDLRNNCTGNLETFEAYNKQNFNKFNLGDEVCKDEIW